MHEYRQYLPAAPLADLIECYWIYHSPGPSPGDYARGDIAQGNGGDQKERLIPGGRVELIFNFSDPLDWLIDTDSSKIDRLTRAHIMGQRNRIYYARETGRTDMLGIRFKTGGVIAFSPIPVSGFLNQLVPAEVVFGQVLNQWESLLFEKKTDQERMLLLDRLLLKEVRSLPQEWEALKMAITSLKKGIEDSSLQMICHQTGWHYKKLERTFLKAVGYTPKHYGRITRFNRAIRKMKNGSRSLTEIGYDCGYFDQSHFIRDFYQFAGTTPGHFQSEEHKMADMLIEYQPV
ncbi:helix-turn-helix domain-containing protein [Flavitalea flava]